MLNKSHAATRKLQRKQGAERADVSRDRVQTPDARHQTSDVRHQKQSRRARDDQKAAPALSCRRRGSKASVQMESVGSMFGFFCCKVAISERKSIRNGTQKWCHPVAPKMWGRPRLLQCLFFSGCSSNMVAGTSAKQPRAGSCRPEQAEADKSSGKELARKRAEKTSRFHFFFEPCRRNQVTISGYRK